MTMYSNISTTAALIGDATRTGILMALADGKALTAGELAHIASVSPQTASSHLNKLMEGGLIKVEVQGRHRYFKLSGPEVARAIEAIAIASPPLKVRSLRQSSEKKALEYARTCYGHLAGKLGVATTDALIACGYFRDIGDVYQLTDRGQEWLIDFGVQPFLPKKIDFNAIPQHLDWTERRHHIGGPLALAITRRLHDLGWIEDGPIRRSIKLTRVGRACMQDEFGIDTDQL
ncbi:DNA-binding transcriptional ArsR family regulator [Scopulibacillus darangshiensis]|uniref:DNA-binding transcriptional ArsR family regulator n=1 Tax=Scopulibacillus darangshiensis TaxID=442528 RepID=A0A4R2P7C9_9BACL|nr:winged helix-turn-helix domain-containing protein [Scopulibacillus darangshiensis]TCP29725.1 DNA-binding transcriptional ArsR family regulator [Scopulibacillus darangshiensis]